MTGRWGEPAPTPNDGPPIHDLVAVDVESRKQFGLTKYGVPLQAHNGRDAIQDAYEEALDLVCYLRQAIAERADGTPPNMPADMPAGEEWLGVTTPVERPPSDTLDPNVWAVRFLRGIDPAELCFDHLVAWFHHAIQTGRAHGRHESLASKDLA